MHELSRKPQGSTAAQASGEESGTPACVSDPPRGLEPSGSSAHLQRHKESPLTTQRDHMLVCKVFITVFGRECCVCVLRKRRKKKKSSPPRDLTSSLHPRRQFLPLTLTLSLPPWRHSACPRQGSLSQLCPTQYLMARTCSEVCVFVG